MEPIKIANNYQARTTARTHSHSRNMRNRITCAYSPEERAAIEWLNRTPFDQLPDEFQRLQNKPRREIAKQLSADQLQRLVAIHRARLAAKD